MSKLVTPARAPVAIPTLSPVAAELTAEEFRAVRALLYETAGIALQPGKEGLVRSRLGARLRALELTTVHEYLQAVEHDRSGAELARMVDVLTTNKTSFFREPEHFRFLETHLVPSLAARGGPIRLWSAGCSSGEEPYSLAMVLRDALPPDRVRETRILATDISTRVLVRARAASYPAELVADVPPALVPRHFVRDDAADPMARHETAQRLRVVDETRSLVTVARLNLMAGWPMRGPFDAIFCRNVMIYFDKPTQERLVRRFAELLAPGGFLFVGHSESLTSLEHGLRYRQPAVYQR